MAKRGGFPGGMPGNMNNLMKQAQRMQKQMEEIQNRWKETDPYTWVYIQTMLQEAGNDYRYFEIDLNE